jgi:hypothetical protein
MIAIPFALITILLLPVDFHKYKLKLVSNTLADKHKSFSRLFYQDLNSDGISEEIINFQDFPGINAIKVKTKNDILLDQWNFNGDYNPDFCHTFFYDYNHDSLTEIFTVYARNDSIFIAAFQPFDDKSLLIKDVFVDTIWNINNKIDFICDQLTGHDLDKDGTDELIFSINAGFSKYPRKIYAWNIEKNSLLKSPNSGFKKNSFDFKDINQDGLDEILVSTCSQNNIKLSDNIPFPDDHLWFCVLDCKLNFLFQPVKVSSGSGSVTVIIPDKTAFPGNIILECFNRNSAENYTYFNFNQGIQKLKPLNPGFESIIHSGLQPFNYAGEPGYLLADFRKGIFWMDETLNSTKLLFRTKTNKSNPLQINLDNDSSNELILLDEFGKISVLSDDFKHLANFELPIVQKLQQISVRELSQHEKHLVIQTDQVIHELDYQKNPLYLLKWALYGLIYLLYSLTIWIILHYQNKYIENKYKLAKNLAELRLKAIRNQMDPHFTFNAINAIAATFIKEDKQLAYSYFSKFSQLIRMTMLYSDVMSRSLTDEIDFTVKYLEIEKLRFKEKFEYHISVNEDVEEFIEVPRMALQAFAESALNNGLMHRSENGLLKINISMENNYIVFLITDNGGGIQKSKLLNKEKAFKSLKIIDEFFSILNSFNQTKITYTMKDLTENNEIKGTRVIVRIPTSLKYTF